MVSGPIVEHASSADGQTFVSASFQCCSTEEGREVVAAYDALGQALSADEFSSSLEKLTGLKTAVAALPPAESEALRAAIRTWGVTDIEAVREGLLTVTPPMLEFVKSAKSPTGSSGQAYTVAFCPMKPGRWLQSTDGIRNPYYGASMLACGVFEAL